MSNRWAKKGDPLTVREFEVALLLTEGHSNKIIADKLGIADHTAKFHVFNVVKKLGGQNRVETAVIYARQLYKERLEEERASWLAHSNELALQIIELQTTRTSD
jgi:DNA-binding CsgD family transcriptional regulator